MDSANPIILLALAGVMNQQYENAMEFLNTEIKVLRELFKKKRISFNNEQRALLARTFKKIDSELAKKMELIVTPRTLMRWYDKLIKEKWDFSEEAKKKPGRPKLSQESVDLVLKLIEENPERGDVDISNKLKNLELEVSSQMVRNLRKKYGIPPASDREKTGSWQRFLELNWEGLVAMDFKTVEVVIPGSTELETYYVLFAMRLETREVTLCGMTKNPKSEWMEQVARNLTDPFDGFFMGCSHCILDNDRTFSSGFKEILRAAGVKPVRIVKETPNKNAHMERFIRSYKNEALKWVIPHGEDHLKKVTKEWLVYYNSERNHQGADNKIILPGPEMGRSEGYIKKRPRIGGTLNYYYRETA